MGLWIGVNRTSCPDILHCCADWVGLSAYQLKVSDTAGSWVPCYFSCLHLAHTVVIMGT